MNRQIFMEQLENLLQSISYTEREEALQYYNDYFDDAGAENEQEVIEALGTPGKVAENIKKDLFGYGNARFHRPTAEDRVLAEYTTEMVASAPAEEGSKVELPKWAMILIIVLVVLASPIGAGIIGCLGGIVISWFAFMIAFAIAAAALIIAAVITLIAGAGCCAVNPWAGVTVMGVALVTGGIGVLFLMLFVAMAGHATPAIGRWIVSLITKIKGKFRRGEE